jgi:uncharacterized protein involved in type VI secretion and phage assembly
MMRDSLPLSDFGLPAHALAMPYLARVVAVDDPLSLARVKVQLFNLDGSGGAAGNGEWWARVASPFAGAQRGGFFIPEVDDEVLVVFVNGDARHPVVVGGLWNGAAAPPETIGTQVDRWSITGKAGTRIAIVEESAAQAKIECTTPGGISLTMKDDAGGSLVIECAGNTITIDTQGVSIQAAAKVTVQAANVEVSAGMVRVDAAMSRFSGVVQCDTLITNSVISSAYTPGAGNIW